MRESWSIQRHELEATLERIFQCGLGALGFIGLLTVLILALRIIDQGIGVAAGEPAQITAEMPVLLVPGEPASDAIVGPLAVEPASDARAIQPTAARTPDARQMAAARYVARSYRIAREVAEDLVMTAVDVGGIVGIEPGLLLAVMAIESRFNPVAESDMGAKGLMQVIPKYHADKLSGLGGIDAVLDPWVNILVGAQILREYVSRSGSLERGLQLYNGAPNDATRQYADRILNEKAQFDRVLVERRPRNRAGTPI